MKLFEYRDEELPEVCVEAVLDEDCNLQIDESNVVRENGVMFFKRPIKINAGTFFICVPDQIAIVKESKDRNDFFLFALSESRKSRIIMRDFYENEHLFDKGYLGRRCFPKEWKGNFDTLREVN